MVNRVVTLQTVRCEFNYSTLTLQHQMRSGFSILRTTDLLLHTLPLIHAQSLCSHTPWRCFLLVCNLNSDAAAFRSHDPSAVSKRVRRLRNTHTSCSLISTHETSRSVMLLSCISTNTVHLNEPAPNICIKPVVKGNKHWIHIDFSPLTALHANAKLSVWENGITAVSSETRNSGLVLRFLCTSVSV